MEEKKGRGFWEWLKGIGAGLLVWFLKSAVPRILVKILEKADMNGLADKVRPHLRKLFNALGPDMQAALTLAIRKMADFAEELLENEEVGN